MTLATACEVQQDLELIKDCAMKMANPDYVKMVVSDPNNHPPNLLVKRNLWGELSIAGGYPGIMPLFIQLDQQFPNEGWGETTHQYVLKTVKTLESAESLNPSLFGGLAGICLYLRLASKGETRYQKVLSKLDSLLVNLVKETHIRLFNENLKAGLYHQPRVYETILGLSGIGIYVLFARHKEPLQLLAYDIIQVLIELTKPIQVSGDWVPGWYVPSEYFFLDEQKVKHPKGNFNLGLSHGIPGVLAFLSIAMLQGIKLKGQKEAIEVLVAWIKSKRIALNDRYFWGTQVTFEDEIQGRCSPQLKSKDAWCYGTPGVARALYLAGRALRDKDTQEFAYQSFLSVFQSSQKEWGLMGPTMCHGFSGLFMMTQKMAQNTKCRKLQQRVGELREIVLSFYDSNTPFGFQHKELVKDNQASTVWVNKADVLEGATGPLLSLLSLHTDDYQWHLPFLIDF